MVKDGDLLKIWGITSPEASSKKPQIPADSKVTWEDKLRDFNQSKSKTGPKAVNLDETGDALFFAEYSSEDELSDNDEQVAARLQDGVDESFESIVIRDCGYLEDDNRLSLAQKKHEKNFRYKSFEPEVVSSGIEEHEFIRMADGSSKMIKDICVGDYVLDRYGTPRQVERVDFDFSELYEVSRMSVNRMEHNFGCQKVLVGAAQKFEVSLGLNPSDAEARHIEGTHQKLMGRTGDYMYIAVPRQLIASNCKDSSNVGPRQLVANNNESQLQFSGTEQSQPLRESSPRIHSKIWCLSEARDLVVYKTLSDAGVLKEAEAFKRTICCKTSLQRQINVSESIVENNLSLRNHKGWQRILFERTARRFFSETRMEDFWYLAGSWVGGGYMDRPYVTVSSTNVETMLRLADCARSLRICCDAEFGIMPKWELNTYGDPKYEGGNCVHLTYKTYKDTENLNELANYARHATRMSNEWKYARRKKEQLAQNLGEPETSIERNPWGYGVATMVLYDGCTGGFRNITNKNWLWMLFLAAGIQESAVQNGKKIFAKTGPEWLITAPVAWRESFLAGLIESTGCKKLASGHILFGTVFEELCYFIMALGRSLGISVGMYAKQANMYHWVDKVYRCEQGYFVRLYDSEPLQRVMSLVVSSHKKPKAPWTGPNGNVEFKPELFHCISVTLYRKGRVGKLKLRNGYECASTCGMMLLAEGAQCSVEASSVRIPASEENYCVACGNTDMDDWYPSWEIAAGRLCYTCGSKYIRSRIHCTKCGYIADYHEIYFLEQDESVNDQGEQVFPCPACQTETEEEEPYAMVRIPYRYKAGPCCSCGRKTAMSCFPVWATKEILCLPCSVRWTKSRVHCDCGYVPFRVEICRAVTGDQGNKIFNCNKCSKEISLKTWH